MRKRVIPVVLAAAVCLSGCGSGSIYTNYRELEQLQLIQSIGVDGAGGGSGVMLTLSSGRGLNKEKALLFSCQAPTVAQAMNRAQDYASSEELYYAHTRYLLVGRETAEAGLASLLDFVARSTQLRLSIDLVIIDEGTAREIMERSGSGDYDVTETLDSIARDAVYRGDSQVRTVGALLRDLAERRAGLVCAVHPAPLEGTLLSDSAGQTETPSGQGALEQSGESRGGEQQNLTLLPAGFGVVVGDRVAAWLRDEAARGVSILTEQLGAATLTVDCPEYGEVVLTATQCRCEAEPVFDGNDRLSSLKVTVHLAAAVAEMPDGSPPPTPEFSEAVRQQLEREAIEWIRAPLELSQRLEADFLALGPQLAKHAPRQITGPEWVEGFGEAQLELSVQARIERADESEGSVVSD